MKRDYKDMHLCMSIYFIDENSSNDKSSFFKEFRIFLLLFRERKNNKIKQPTINKMPCNMILFGHPIQKSLKRFSSKLKIDSS